MTCQVTYPLWHWQFLLLCSQNRHGDPVWSTQEGEGQQTLRVCRMSVTHSHCLPQAAWSSVVDVVTFTHRALAASGSGVSLGLSPCEKGTGLGFLLRSPSDIVTEPAGCCHLGVPGCSVQPQLQCLTCCFCPCLRPFLPMPQHWAITSPSCYLPGLCLVPC